MSKLSTRLRELRIEKQLSQAELAKETKLSQSAIASWELDNSQPNSGAIIILSRYFDVSCDYLLGEVDNA